MFVQVYSCIVIPNEVKGFFGLRPQNDMCLSS